MILRPYQRDAVDATLEAFRNHQSALIVLPTGCVSGGTMIGLNRAGKGYSLSIAHALFAESDLRYRRDIPTMIRAYDGKSIRLHRVISFIDSGTKETFLLELENGKTLRATPDHGVLTENGFVEAGALRTSDRVMCEGNHKQHKPKKKNYRQVQGLVKHPYSGGAGSYRRRGNHVEGRLHRVPYHRLVVEAALNDLGIEQLIERCRFGNVDGLMFLDPLVFAVHHEDGNHLNNSASNLLIMTHDEHLRHEGISKAYHNFGYDGVLSSSVKTIRRIGPEPTFDIVCDDPHHNFLANGIIVHNCGKTICFAHLINAMMDRGRAMVLAHRQELIHQAADKIECVTGIKPDIEMAGRWAAESGHFRGKSPIVVSSVQTQGSRCQNGKRMHRFLPEEFGLLIIDECHHGTSSSYVRIMHYYKQNHALRILGVTATPDRLDKQALGKVFECAPYTYEIEDAISDGWLVPIRQQYIVCRDLDFSAIGTVAGDLNQGELAAVVEQETPLHEMVGPTIDIAGNRRTLFFCVSVKQAERVCEIFNRHKANSAACVFGRTDDDDRRVTLEKFGDGTIQTLVNVGVATEGYDNPGIEIVAVGRPTKSRALYSQMVGRGTRTLPGIVDGIDLADDRRQAIAASGKPIIQVLDFVGNSGRHKLVSAADVLGGRFDERDVAAAKEAMERSGKPEDIEEKIKEAKQKRLINQLIDADRRAAIRAKAEYQAREVDAFKHRQNVPQQSKGFPRHWYFRPATEKQAAILAKRGLLVEGMTIAQASRAIDEIAEREGWRKHATA